MKRAAEHDALAVEVTFGTEYVVVVRNVNAETFVTARRLRYKTQCFARPSRLRSRCATCGVRLEGNARHGDASFTDTKADRDSALRATAGPQCTQYIVHIVALVAHELTADERE